MHMKDFMERFSLVATNMRFQNRTGKLWTHRRPSGNIVQLDYILARKKWINSIKNSRAYSSFEGVKSDHRIVSCKCQISYRKSNVPTQDPMKQIDWRKVVGDANLCEEFTVAVHNRFNTLCDKLEDKSASVVYDSWSIANRDIALEMLSKKKKKILIFASNKTVTKAREELKNAAQKHQFRSTRNTERNLEAAKASLDEASQALEAHVKSKTEELDNLHNENKHAAAWVALRELTNSRDSPVLRIAGETTEGRLDAWFQHFSSLLGKPDQCNTRYDNPFFSHRVAESQPI